MSIKSITLVIALWGVFSLDLSAQLCSGSLGENIFLDGNFGSGTSSIVQDDPGIAPGFIYNNAPPPSDGQYTITNSIEAWNSAFVTWLELTGDNSDDPNGYMMVVNASYEPGIFYTEQIDGLCANTLFEFTADIINLNKPGTNIIKPDVSFLLNGQEFYSTGPVEEDAIWHTFGFTFETLPGQTSLELSLRNNAEGGTGNDLALDNIRFRACGPEALILPQELLNVCEDGDSLEISATVFGTQYDDPAYQWQKSDDGGLNWMDIAGANGLSVFHVDFVPGTYHYRYLMANGEINLDNDKCRVISNEKIIYVQPREVFTVDTICSGVDYIQGDNVYTESGIYIDTFLSFWGCDSVVTLDLTTIENDGIDWSYTAEDPKCHNEANGSISVELLESQAPPYSAYLNGEMNQEQTLLFTGLQGGIYTLLVEDRYRCQSSEEVNLVNPDSFYVFLGDDVEIDLGDEVRLSLQTNSVDQLGTWTYGSLSGDCQDSYCSEFDFFPFEGNAFVYNAVNADGCEAEDIVLVNLVETRKVYAPNAFSPNGDGINDLFYLQVETPNVSSVLEFSIYDRWGNHVFYRQNLLPDQLALESWDGTYKSKPLQSAQYLYTSRVLFIDGTILEYSGGVNLLR